jgi:hypothetical protein
MPSPLADVSWPAIETLRARVSVTGAAPTVEAAARQLVGVLVDEFATIVLARVFIVTRYAQLPARDRAFVDAFAARVGKAARLTPDTLVLSLLATRGVEPAWNSRLQSAGHLAIPLLDRELVDSAPMIAALLAALDVDVAALATAPAIATRRMVGVRNARFYVADAQTATDANGAHIIAAREFVAKHRIRTVFGMGGAYLDGRLIVALMFTTELLEPLVVDRFPSLISNFKIATQSLIASDQVYSEP